MLQYKFRLTVVTLVACMFLFCTSPEPTGTPIEPDSEYYSLADFKAVQKIDAHVHINTYDSSLVEQADNDNMKLFTINYDDVNDPPPMEEQQEYAVHLVKKYPQNVSYATTISIKKFNNEDWFTE